tara:strand:+ start:782 stop:1075 length:294 start_codon:yes stop_codon:yes gene_type:complete
MENKMKPTKKETQEVSEFQQIIYYVLHQHTDEAVKDQIHPSSVLNIQAAVLLKTAIELYTLHFRKDEDIQRILDVAKDSLTQVRNRIDEETTPHTYH